LPVLVWLVAAALVLSDEPPPGLVVVASLAAEVSPEVEADVVKADAPVETAVEAEAEAPVVAEAPTASVAVIWTGKNTFPGTSVRGMPTLDSETVPLSFKLKEHSRAVESYLQLSEMVL
jgi:hypothetical protein